MQQRPGQFVPASEVLAHRGIWFDAADQNSPKALREALELGFGVETDVRDYLGGIVISHDIPHFPQLALVDMLTWSAGHSGVIALNIKADGLGPSIKRDLQSIAESEVFAFDMSVPQARVLSSLGLPIAARVSEFESIDGLRAGPYASSKYLWIDCFNSDWFLNDDSLLLALEGRTGILVSPEVHGRNYVDGWVWTLDMRLRGYRVGICTDYPLQFMAWQSQVSSS